MRLGALLAVALLAIGCGQSGSGTARGSPSASASTIASASPSPSAGPCKPASSYGLLLSAGTLELVDSGGCVAATAPVAAPSVEFCAQGLGAVLQPPVSASSDRVYFRDGSTKIRYVTPDGHSEDATTVPGSPTTISFFSVSPDDQRIAVVVEDVSPASSINLRLYVEDLNGGGHHADIYTTTTTKTKTGSTLWPMGWHGAQLVLEVVPACTFEPAHVAPISWHVVDAATAVRKASIGDTCIPSAWPSRAGAACVNTGTGVATRYDWSGKAVGTLPALADERQSGLSPSGLGIFLVGGPIEQPHTRIIGATASVTAPGHAACLWIDDDHVLAPDAVIEFPSGKATALPQSGVCAGRFPGGL